MATERQIAANRANALKSSGPATVEGKERSRGNAFKHGLTGSGEVLAAARTEEFESRRAKWAESIQPDNSEASLALDVAVTASLRIEECSRAYDAMLVEQRTRAHLTWDLDRRAEAVVLAAGLSKNPIRTISLLETTKHGVELLLEYWHRFDGIHYIQNDWTEFDRSQALDLLGVPHEARTGRTVVDGYPDCDLRAFRRAIVIRQVERLITLKDTALDALDALQRDQAKSSALAILSKPATLILRYERAALRTFETAMKAAKIKSPETAAESTPQKIQMRPPEPKPIQEKPAKPQEPSPSSPPDSSPNRVGIQVRVTPESGETNPFSEASQGSTPRNRHERRALAAHLRRP